MAKHTLPRYAPSGFFRLTTIALFIGAIAAGCGVAWLYQTLVRWIPFIYINALVVLGFGGALAVGGYLAVKYGHCRNRVLGLVLALPLAAAPLAASYYWDYAHVVGKISEKNPGVSDAEIKQEMPFGRFLELKKQAGWKIKSSTFNGGGVTFIWIIEALAVFGITLFGVSMAVGEPYCERCNEWCADRAFTIWGVGAPAAEPLLTAGNLGGVAELSAPEGADTSINLTVTVTTCPKCTQTGFMTVQEKIITVKKGKTEEKATHLVKHAVLGSDHLIRAVDRVTNVAGQKLATG